MLCGLNYKGYFNILFDIKYKDMFIFSLWLYECNIIIFWFMFFFVIFECISYIVVNFLIYNVWGFNCCFYYFSVIM